MKTNEELKALRKELEALNKKLAELTKEELEQVSGGDFPNIKPDIDPNIEPEPWPIYDPVITKPNVE